MSKYDQTYYTTGEFAKLCHTSKDTLFHYDKIGLLKPQIIKDNGYRLYLFYQYFDYDLIKVLQEANMSLNEIKDFMKERNNDNYIKVLKEKYDELENERKRIEGMQYRIKKAISLNEYGINTPHMIPFIEECEEEHLMTISLPHRKISDQEMIKYVSEHFDYCIKNHLNEELPLGSIVKKEHFINHDYIEDYYYVKIEKKVDDSKYLLKPKGLYASIIHEGYYDTVKDSLNVLYHYIKDNGYEIVGDCYEYDIHNYLNVDDVNKYLNLLSVQIEK